MNKSNWPNPFNKSYYVAADCHLYSAEQIKLVESNYANIDPQGTYPLMERAGLSAFESILTTWPDAKNWLIVVGKGNNGGDGLIVARLALDLVLAKGIKVTLLNLNSTAQFKNDAYLAWLALEQSPLYTYLNLITELPEDLSAFDLLVDAMLGTGLQGAVREPYAQIIDKINQATMPVLAIDIPSGLQADTGVSGNPSIIADKTVTYIAPKKGLYTGDAADFRGEVVLADLQIGESSWQGITSQITAKDYAAICSRLYRREHTSHKGHFGYCRVIGGANGMIGAALLAANAAARVGSGLTSAWVEAGAEVIVSRVPEIMAKNVHLSAVDNLANQVTAKVPLELPTSGQAEDADERSSALISALVIGPGLGQSLWGRTWLRRILGLSHSDYLNIAKVFDADALNILAREPTFDNHRILTPHPGEAARLLDMTTQEIHQDRYAASAMIAQRYGGVCVLKGAGTIISDAFGRQTVCPVGNPGMASGGMGDVLSGIIGGLLAQQYALFDAAVMGVCIHGEAADYAAGTEQKYRGLLASDLIDYLPPLVNPC
ncbi:NAD(P)H-hydrate dehydratase [Aliikangiella maris]|uniref:Bifunctional NAD(P)H-hydrate repair enzyme n=2 Tax=Aliikangiella maris TaxID=3162458 RepID=A0ABV3MQ50_9GAMM